MAVARSPSISAPDGAARCGRSSRPLAESPAAMWRYDTRSVDPAIRRGSWPRRSPWSSPPPSLAIEALLQTWGSDPDAAASADHGACRAGGGGRDDCLDQDGAQAAALEPADRRDVPMRVEDRFC